MTGKDIERLIDSCKLTPNEARHLLNLPEYDSDCDVAPRELCIQTRICDLQKFIHRRFNSCMRIPLEAVKEYNDLLAELESIKRRDINGR